MNEFFNHLKCGNRVKLAEHVSSFERRFTNIGEDCKAQGLAGWFCYKRSLNLSAQMIYRWHFGFRGKLVPRQVLGKGVEMALAYFRLTGERLTAATPDTEWTAEGDWFQPYCEALLLATLAGAKRERAQLSDCLHPNLVVEETAIPIERALGDVVLSVAASFQSRAMDTTTLVERLQKCRKQRPKLLYRAWQALESGKRQAFVAAITDSTVNFAKTTAEDDVPLTAIALQESILVALAYERGWTDLSFKLPIAARLVTHQSLELS